MTGTEVPAHVPPIATRSRGRAAVALALAVALAALVGAPARAAYGPGGEAASANGTLLGDGASTSPSISDDGRYVAFSTAAVNLLGRPPDPGEAYDAGIVRRDMVTGVVELVAPPQVVRREDGTALRPGVTRAPSISGNGRYVLFDTTMALTAGDENGRNDVYVRDMDIPLTQTSAYELVSALHGTDVAAGYTDDDPTKGSRAGRQGFGLSDDGRRAVFRTEARSTLPAGGTTPAPPAQLFVRLLDTRATLLVTRERLPDGSMSEKPVERGAGVPQLDPVLSGDGTTVAWVDTNAAAQTRTLAGEPPVAAILWRDISAGPGAPSRRVAGTSDPDDPGCPPGATYPDGSTTDTGPCYGPFAESEALEDGTPISGLSISDDGRRVLFLTKAQQRPFDPATAGKIAYLADMTAGLTRKHGVRRILRVLGENASPAEPTLSGSGTGLAFTSAGRVFEGPRSVGSFPAGEPSTNVFVVDLAQGIVQRATVGADGTDYRGPRAGPQLETTIDPLPSGLALSDDAGAIAFSAAAGNLFPGDANDVLDVQVVRSAPGGAIPLSAFTAPAPLPTTPLAGELRRPLSPLAPVHPVIGHLAVDRRGVARLTVRVPAGGRLSATASAVMPRLRGARPAAAGGCAGRARVRCPRRLRVASASRRPRRAMTAHLRLAPTPTARRAARRAGRLRIRIDVRYAPAAGRPTNAIRSYTLTRSAAAR